MELVKDLNKPCHFCGTNKSVTYVVRHGTDEYACCTKCAHNAALHKIANQFIICVDLKVVSDYIKSVWQSALGFSCDGTFLFKELKATNIYEAMREAEEYWDEEVYLITIAEKCEEQSSYDFVDYHEVLTTRTGSNFHLTDSKHSEKPWCISFDPETNFFVLRCEM